jgi:acetolactate synthase-1/2/3 large subunit
LIPQKSINVKTTVAVLADLKESLTALLPLIESNSHEAWHNEFKEKYEIELEAVINDELKPKRGNFDGRND